MKFLQKLNEAFTILWNQIKDNILVIMAVWIVIITVAGLINITLLAESTCK